VIGVLYATISIFGSCTVVVSAAKAGEHPHMTVIAAINALNFGSRAVMDASRVVCEALQKVGNITLGLIKLD